MQIPKKIFSIILFTSCLLFYRVANAQETCPPFKIKTDSELITGARQLEQYLPLIRSKRVAVVANQTSILGNVHLVDTLNSLGIRIKCVFAPEHGFRGESGAGEKIHSGVDPHSGLPVISLYGKHLKPTREDLQDVDIVIFDIQDVGARFYTYISTLQYVMEACAEQEKTLLILDRPNPNGFYIDGPLLEAAKYKSFVGMNAIPIVYGMTVGEYALMLNGERWLEKGQNCTMKIISVKNYSHCDLYQLPVRPSPNLPNMTAVYLYPSLCLFEGTRVSVGRGTELPFQQIGFPGFKSGDVLFTPKTIPGYVTHPPYEDTICSGLDLSNFVVNPSSPAPGLNIEWLQLMFKAYGRPGDFFIPFFTKLSGTRVLKMQIEKEIPLQEIRKSWEPGLRKFKALRKKYLLYPDFE